MTPVIMMKYYCSRTLNVVSDGEEAPMWTPFPSGGEVPNKLRCWLVLNQGLLWSVEKRILNLLRIVCFYRETIDKKEA